MKRKIVTIDPDLCNGCGLCVSACHEGALKLVDGKARLVSDSTCDGLGDCLPECPTGAIKIVEREADPFDVAAKQAAEQSASSANASSAHSASLRETPAAVSPLACGCPGKMAKTIVRQTASVSHSPDSSDSRLSPTLSVLVNWPVQIKLVPVSAPYLKNAALLIAADCTAFAYADFHRRFMTGKVTLIGCPKLDEGDYAEKLTAILRANDIRSVTVLRMDVPCCAGIAHATQQALLASGKMIPWHVVTISTDGAILDE